MIHQFQRVLNVGECGYIHNKRQEDFVLDVITHRCFLRYQTLCTFLPRGQGDILVTRDRDGYHIFLHEKPPMFWRLDYGVDFHSVFLSFLDLDWSEGTVWNVPVWIHPADGKAAFMEVPEEIHHPSHLIRKSIHDRWVKHLVSCDKEKSISRFLFQYVAKDCICLILEYFTTNNPSSFYISEDSILSDEETQTQEYYLSRRELTWKSRGHLGVTFVQFQDQRVTVYSLKRPSHVHPKKYTEYIIPISHFLRFQSMEEFILQIQLLKSKKKKKIFFLNIS